MRDDSQLPVRRERGSAAVEFVVLVPFILVLTAAVWDLRVFTAFRTDVAREIFVVAELIASGGNWSSDASVENVIEAAAARLGETSAGVLHVAVVTRATTRHDGTACVDDNQWCAPLVAKAFYDHDFPNGTGDCGNFPRTLPNEGDLFAQDATVLPFEDADPDGDDGPEAAPTVDEWASRNMQPEEWWVIVDSCSHFGEGPRSRLIGKRFMHLGLAWLDVSPVMQRRAAWGSVDDFSACNWC
ncbi:MAG: hypothetical protein OXH52_10480 [Gammaproteobacteria bacterium]|nr:hypothetical protein [Gammaproteobacteria bacterium]